MYTDGTSVACSAEDTDELCIDLKTEVEIIVQCLRQKELSMNIDKTEYMVVNHN